MDDRFSLIRYDENRNAPIAAGGCVVIGLALVLCVAVAVGVWRTL